MITSPAGSPAYHESPTASKEKSEDIFRDRQIGLTKADLSVNGFIRQRNIKITCPKGYRGSKGRRPLARRRHPVK